MIGAMNLCISLSTLYVECEALIWVMEYMKTLDNEDVVFATAYSQLVKLMSSPDEWPIFSIHLEEFRCSNNFFFYLQDPTYIKDNKSSGRKTCTKCQKFPFNYVLCWFHASGLIRWTKKSYYLVLVIVVKKYLYKYFTV